MFKSKTGKKLVSMSFLFIALLLVYMMPDSNYSNRLELGNSDIEYNYSNICDVLYLLDSNNYVARVEVNSLEKKDAVELTNMLVEDGKYGDDIPNGFHTLIPAGTEVLDISLNNKILTIDFSEEFLNINRDYEDKMFASLIYTLTDIEGIDGITIKVCGKVLEKMPNSKREIPLILDRRFGINKQYDLVNTMNIDSYNLYYVSSFNNNIYYVPVTKYVNNKEKDRVKVIIDELSSEPVYDNTLSSFLNKNISLVNYEINEDTINLDFNEAILNSSNNDILEEVIYTIYLSLEDNLNIRDMSISVNDKVIVDNVK